MKTAMRTILICIMTISVLTSCKETNKKAMETQAIRFEKEGELIIYKKDNTSNIALDIEIADTDYETATGLMHRDHMEEHQGMLFIFPDVAVHDFYMKNTKIPLDIIFIDAQLKIASFQKNAVPMDETSLSSKIPVQYVLEVNAGLIDQWSLQVQDSIAFKKY